MCPLFSYSSSESNVKAWINYKGKKLIIHLLPFYKTHEATKQFQVIGFSANTVDEIIGTAIDQDQFGTEIFWAPENTYKNVKEMGNF